MKTLLRRAASLRLTLVGIAWLLATVLLAHGVGAGPQGFVVPPLALLALNLLAAILTNPAFRVQSALLVFHVGLLAVVLLSAAGVLAGYEGRIELVEGQRFDAARVEEVRRGWLHRDRLAEIGFVQGPLEVDYRPGLARAATRSEVAVAGETRRIGDRIGTELAGYRLQTTFNKGYALVLAWDDGQSVVAGAVHFPSYPEYEWNQQNVWETPAGDRLTIELELADRVSPQRPWTLRSGGTAFRVTVRQAGAAPRHLGPGDAIALAGGTLTVADLRLWMGYRVDANPLLPWILAAALVALAALAAHVIRGSATGAAVPAARPAGLRVREQGA